MKLVFSTFVGHFCPPGSGSGSGFRIRIRIHRPDWIRIWDTASMFYLGHDVGLLAAVEVSVSHARHAGLRVRLPRPHSRGPLSDLNRIKNYIPVLSSTERRGSTVTGIKTTVGDSHWLQSGSGSRELNQSGSMRLRNLVRLWRHKKLNFCMKIYIMTLM